MTDQVTSMESGSENIQFKLSQPTEPQVMKKYIVLVENGIFKNGKTYQKGETLDLEEKTGERFAARGEVEESK